MKTKKDNEWAVLLTEAVRSKEKLPVGSDWKMADEIADEMGINRVSVKRRLHLLTSSGSVEKFNGTKMTAEGRVCNMTWYRIKKGKK